MKKHICMWGCMLLAALILSRYSVSLMPMMPPTATACLLLMRQPCLTMPPASLMK